MELFISNDVRGDHAGPPNLYATVESGCWSARRSLVLWVWRRVIPRLTCVRQTGRKMDNLRWSCAHHRISTGVLNLKISPSIVNTQLCRWRRPERLSPASPLPLGKRILNPQSRISHRCARNRCSHRSDSWPTLCLVSHRGVGLVRLLTGLGHILPSRVHPDLVACSQR